MKFFIEVVRENHQYRIRYNDGSLCGTSLGDITFLPALQICEIRFYGWLPTTGVSIVDLAEMSDVIQSLEDSLVEKCGMGDIS